MKRLMVLALTLILTLSLFAAPAMAAREIQAAGAQSAAPLAEEVTSWIYRHLENGQRQKRLWSVTYKRWLTDWINC